MGRTKSRLAATLTIAAALVVSTVPAAQATPSTIGDAQLVAIDGTTLAHTIRYANGDWQRFGHLDVAAVGQPASVIVNGEEHLFFAQAPTGQGALTHYIRHADGTWDVNGSVPEVAPDQIGSISVTSVGGRLVLARLQNWTALVSTQQADGTWSTWEKVPFEPEILSLSVTADGGTLRVVALTEDSNFVLVENRSPTGTWSASPKKSVQVIGPPIAAINVAAAQVGVDLQVVLRYVFGQDWLWHTILRSDNTWTSTGDVEYEGGTGRIPSISSLAVAASTNGSLQVATATEDGAVYHTVRHADGTWQPFGDVRSVAGPVSTTSITLAADNG
ncbi:hypothetical protein [Kutzneria sp. CA-103260]|uniref:hypothetical protein n=1 Tax=Kutzneria sp. CA-103260 TaxID=2802641 RepID=UPI001BA98F38|nr:hypothetical protein [Kutzneria sp. CA-103260]QUQ69127.1 hypothetical protein JJ691_68810 [Kutzneria sp. CA-103260]